MLQSCSNQRIREAKTAGCFTSPGSAGDGEGGKAGGRDDVFPLRMKNLKLALFGSFQFNFGKK